LGCDFEHTDCHAGNPISLELLVVQSKALVTSKPDESLLGTKHLKATLDEPLKGVNFPFNRVILELGKVGGDGE
ncbi:hypothetical protein Tco_0484640, partial [Tanacetum coccineum]